MYGDMLLSLASGFKYFVTFIDNKSKAMWIYFLKNTSEVYFAFKKFYFLVETQYNTKIKVIRFDNGGKYINLTFETFTKKRRIIHQTTYKDTPQ